MSELWVDPAMVVTAAQDWRGESDRLTAATKRVAAAPTSGFSAALAGDVRGFLVTWAEITGTSASAAAAMAAKLETAMTAYWESDHQAQTDFRDWLEGRS